MSRRLVVLLEGALVVALVLVVSGFTRSDSAVELRVDGVARSVETRADNADFLGCLAGKITFGPGWEEPLPPEDWEALR